MAVIDTRWADQNVKVFGKQLKELQRRFPLVLPRIINQVGNRSKTLVIRNLTTQTGLPRRTVVKAVGDPSAARAGRLSYEMVTRGGSIRLKYLAPRETRPGVTATPWGKRTLFAGTFMRGGRFPNRKIVAKFDGHVMRRIGNGGRTDGSVGEKLTHARSGMFIPTEMTRGATREAFVATAGPLLRQRIEAALAKLVP